MMMELNEKTRALLEGLPASDGSADWRQLSEENHAVAVMKNLDGIRRWLGMADELRSVRPGPIFLSVLLGHGREGALKIFESYAAETMRTDAESKSVLGALSAIAMRANSLGLTNWNLTGVTLEAARGKPRILVAFDDADDARMRGAAAARGETLSDFIRESVRDRLAKIEKPSRRSAAQ